MPAPERLEDLIFGGIYWHTNTIDIWTGKSYRTIARLVEWDGKSMLRWRPE